MKIVFGITQLIDTLLCHWSFWDQYEDYYLQDLVPKLISDPSLGDEIESEIFAMFRNQLSSNELDALPNQIKLRRTEGLLNKIAFKPIPKKADRLRQAEAEEQARQAALKFELQEQERIKEYKQRQEAEAKYNEFQLNIRKVMREDFLSTDLYFKNNYNGSVFQEEYQEEKVVFVQKCIKDFTGKELDLEQSAAVASVHNHIQVIARAGSGKTTTIVNRALFLIKHCGVLPNEMLLLAFNKKAAEEMKERLGKALGEQLPHVMTFHALAYSIVHPEEEILYNASSEENQGLNRVVQQLIDNHLKVPEHKEKIRELMLAHFREDWERIVEKGFDKTRDEFLRFRRSLISESLDGKYVKSFGEKIIANFLFEHNVPYIYEKNFYWNNINYKPDFTILKTDKAGQIIEYFGIKGDPDYDNLSQVKREFWKRKPEWGFLEFSSDDIRSRGVDSFLAHLELCLKKNNIPCKKLTEDEIWHQVHGRLIDRFTKAVSGFIGRCRKRCLSPEELDVLISSRNEQVQVEDKFLKIVSRLYREYLNCLKETGAEDFDGLMQRSVEIVSSGNTKFERKSARGDLSKLRYIFIDEFQDFSELFYRLILAIKKHNLSVELFCVGDDWQAINGFAGSDLKFFNRFEADFNPASILHVSTNYRSSKSIVNIGNALMSGLGKPALANKTVAGNVLLADLSEFKPTAIEVERHAEDLITPVVLRLISKTFAKKNASVVLLCRRNGFSWNVKFKDKEGVSSNLDIFLDHIRSFFPKTDQERISISTAHKYKGLEKPMVIVLDAVSRSYPLIHPDWVFTRVLGDDLQKIIDEERRLFYVSLTRAIEDLVIITEKNGESPFLENIEHRERLLPINWSNFPPFSGQTKRLIVKVGNQENIGGSSTFEIKDSLKAEGYQWQSVGWKCWEKTFSVEGFNVDLLKKEIWASKAKDIEVRIFNDLDKLVKKYMVNNAEWDEWK